jgi:hypothetical protein
MLRLRWRASLLVVSYRPILLLSLAPKRQLPPWPNIFGFGDADLQHLSAFWSNPWASASHDFTPRSSAVLTGLFTMTEHHVPPRPLSGPVIWNVFITCPSSRRYDVTDPFHAATGLPEHLFGPGICPFFRTKIVKPFGSPCWSYPCTYPHLPSA